MVQENNKLIAEFMGAIHKEGYVGSGYAGDIPCYLYFPILKRYYSIKRLEYNTSWDWLMPVVEKIESTNILSHEGMNVNIYNCVVEIRCRWKNTLIALHMANTRFEALYNAVVDFITWYNAIPPTAKN